MSNILLSNVNLVDSARVSLSSQAGDLSASNVQDTVIGRRARLSSGMGYLDFDFGNDVAIDVVALVFPRDTPFPTASSDRITHTFDADGGTPGAGAVATSGEIEIGAFEGYGYHAYVPASRVTARYWRATFNVANAFIDIGRVWAGEKFVPQLNVQYGYRDMWNDRSTVSVADRSGAEYVDEKARQRSFSFVLSHMSDADRTQMREIFRTNGISKQLLLVTNPQASELGKEAVVARFVRSAALAQTHFNLSSAPIEIRESL